MKLWNAFGSEHSMNLVIIGRFKETRDAALAKELITRLIEQVNAEPDAHSREPKPDERRFSEGMLQLLTASKLYSLRPSDLEQFQYDAHLEVTGKDVIITTDEDDVAAFLKVLLDRGARIEMYSAHDYPDTEHGR